MLTPEEVAYKLHTMFNYSENEVKGRFKISREKLRELSENNFFESDLPEIHKYLLKRGLYLIDNGAVFGCMSANLVNQWREPKLENVFKRHYLRLKQEEIEKAQRKDRLDKVEKSETAKIVKCSCEKSS